MPATLTLFDQPGRWKRADRGLAEVAGAAALPLPEFTEQAHWTRFLADWCEPGQRAPSIGYQGEGDGREIVALYNGLVLRSVFQPILSASTLLPVAFEAMVRAKTLKGGELVSPDELFARPGSQTQGILLDRICRFIHLLNFERQAPDSATLYLNVGTLHLQALQRGQHGSFMGAMQTLCSVAPSRIILEITETRFNDRDALSAIVHSFKQRGYLVAIDDFGARHSNFDRLWALTPDIVKIDRELLLQADSNPRVRKILPKLVEIMHDLQASVVCEGIETSPQHDLALSSGADLLQGYFFARPARDLKPDCQ
ncbi:MAG: EAL domain-containing protein [Rhodoferax sp.]|jgi:EAL domain-containing protein (putative c-di-GMP-specific phosphodiesterase class I)|nr:EAL domain-containing protein [Rhodoferax sp.]